MDTSTNVAAMQQLRIYYFVELLQNLRLTHQFHTSTKGSDAKIYVAAFGKSTFHLNHHKTDCLHKYGINF
jgi:hypothetical protein